MNQNLEKMNQMRLLGMARPSSKPWNRVKMKPLLPMK